MLKPEQVPSEAIREVMHKFLWHMNEEETPVGEAWSIVIAAALNAWPGAAVCHYTIGDDEGCEMVLPLPFPQEGNDD